MFIINSRLYLKLESSLCLIYQLQNIPLTIKMCIPFVAVKACFGNCRKVRMSSEFWETLFNSSSGKRIPVLSIFVRLITSSSKKTPKTYQVFIEYIKNLLAILTDKDILVYQDWIRQIQLLLCCRFGVLSRWNGPCCLKENSGLFLSKI